MKQRIMEVLFSSSNNLTKQELDWAIANIPNETINQPAVYDHDADVVYQACGLSDKCMDELHNEYVNIHKNNDFAKKSQLIEYVFQNGSPELIRSFAIRGIMDFEEAKHKDIIKKLKSILGKLEE